MYYISTAKLRGNFSKTPFNDKNYFRTNVQCETLFELEEWTTKLPILVECAVE